MIFMTVIFFLLAIPLMSFMALREVKRTYLNEEHEDAPYVLNDAPLRISIKDTEVSALVADTLLERRRGLSGREALPEDTVMLFIFSAPERAGIWMKDMLFSIDIMWIDADRRIIHIVENASPDSFPEVFRPLTDAKYVIEASAGFVAENDIALGDGMSF